MQKRQIVYSGERFCILHINTETWLPVEQRPPPVLPVCGEDHNIVFKFSASVCTHRVNQVRSVDTNTNTESKCFRCFGGDGRDRSFASFACFASLRIVCRLRLCLAANRRSIDDSVRSRRARRKKQEAGNRWFSASFWWRRSGSNRWPLECHSSALPAELRPRIWRADLNPPRLLSYCTTGF